MLSHWDFVNIGRSNLMGKGISIFTGMKYTLEENICIYKEI